MPKRQRTNITRRDAERVLVALKEQCKSWCFDEDGADISNITLAENFDGARFAIIWEEGPYDWTCYFPYGGTEEEFGGRLKDVSSKIPSHLFIEALTSYSVGLFRNNW